MNLIFRKIIYLTIIQSLVSIVIISPFLISKTLQDVIAEDYWINALSLILFVCVTAVVIFCSFLTRVHPYSYVLQFVATVITSFWLGVILSRYTLLVVNNHFYYNCFLSAISHSLVYKTIFQVMSSLFTSTNITVFLFVYGLYTKYDFTVLMGVLLVVTLLAITMCTLFFFYQSWGLKWLIVLISLFLTAGYAVVDVQLVKGGYRHGLSLEDFVLGSSLLYVDIIYIFAYILMMIGDYHT